MSVAVLLGLLSAFCYGATDFTARFAGRRVGTLRTIFYGHIAAAGVTGAALVWEGAPRAGAGIWMLTAASNLVGLAATACLYRALAVGALSVVCPVVATYGGVTALLSCATGEVLGPIAWVGLSAATLGGVLVARPRATSTGPRVLDRGLGPAAIAAICYGVSFWLQGRYIIPRLGPLAPVFNYYVLGALTALVIGLATRRSLAPPSGSAAALVFGVTGFACAGSLVLAFGQTTGEIAIVTVLSALASGVTVLLARVFLAEPVPPSGWLGLGLTMLGVGLLHAR